MNVAKATLVSNKLVASSVMECILHCPVVARDCAPGQFVMLRTFDTGGGYLGRPFAIAGADETSGTIKILFKIAGKGTAQMATLNEGTQLQVLGPLGNGFDLKAAKNKALLIAGGIGVSSLLPLAEALSAQNVTSHLIIGAANAEQLVCVDDFKAYAASVKIATEDGSCGEKGYPMALISSALGSEKYDVIYACGPTPLLKAAAGLAKENGVPMQVSLEQRMACGFGACTACACKTKNPHGDIAMKRVCKEGPVFSAQEVVWDG